MMERHRLTCLGKMCSYLNAHNWPLDDNAPSVIEKRKTISPVKFQPEDWDKQQKIFRQKMEKLYESGLRSLKGVKPIRKSTSTGIIPTVNYGGNKDEH